MANVSTYLADKLIDHYNGRTAYTEPTVYVALFSVAPTMPAGTGGTEFVIGTGSYARVALAGLQGAAAGGAASNSGVITFPQATADQGTAVAWAKMDAATGGNILTSGLLTEAKPVDNGDTFSFPIAALTDSLV